MKNYTITFYLLNDGYEKKIAKYNSTEISFIPRKKDCIVLDEGVFKVKAVAMVYTDEDTTMDFEVMLQEFDDDKEWWE